ncbi:cysteine-rich with EGF-like domain protein 1 [Gouania willdenowi]|uniref:cysteine-rich with EGF-like domain protein 1 n=1 Tax=Gouania willdenowi TaxID=441366 RepID=UPI001054337B|nr:cysteine-rich with EGF-like domain protein 1 [Gouania willdenowi]XP_028303305.1 cysteine-rich with EGF-like domain protein 1 [Gouania willdenowi]
MALTSLHGHLLWAACLWTMLVVQVRGCSFACSQCTEQDKNQCRRCKAGWTLHNNTCTDIDECGTELDTCLQGTYCFNTEGSFECRGCDVACVSCMGSGPARCRKCASGYRLTGPRCSDIDECGEHTLACSGLNEFCINTEGSFRCDCAKGFIRKKSVCVRKKLQHAQDKGLFEDIQDEEVEVLWQMFFGVVLCALATLAAKGDMVYTSVFIGAVAAVASYWLTDRGDRLLDSFLKG